LACWLRQRTRTALAQAEVDATAPKLHDEAVAREAAALVANTFDLWKAKLAPRPEAGRTGNG